MLRLLLVAGAVVATSLPAHAQDDATKGKALFGRCSGCHATTTQNKAGPGLAGVSGRAAASAPGFRYSKALAASGITWTDDQLNAFLAAPTKAVPGSAMPVGLADAAARANVIAFLKTLPAQ